MSSASSTGPADITRFWFGELRDGLANEAQRRRWFMPDPALDAEIRERFGDLLTAALRGELAGWARSPSSALSLVLVCDQFSRQVHRGSRDAYATDPLALQTARRVIERGEDQQLAFDERAFLYMPFQHSESRLDQHTAVGLYLGLRDTASDTQRRHAEGFLKHARSHRDIVLQFGRFPHRNRLLGRQSTAEEEVFLVTARDFGQSSRR